MPSSLDLGAMYSPEVGRGLSFIVQGISDEGAAELSPEARKAIGRHCVFSGGKRHHELVAHLLPEGARWIDVTVPLSKVFDQYRAADCPIFVFASGDPLFFGYTTTLMREFPGLVARTYPHFNSLQLLAHALTLPYHDMRVCSLTGRPWHEFDRALIERVSKLGVLTDRNNTPSAIATRMLTYGYTGYRMHIGVRLGGEREEVHTLPLEEVAGRAFEQPNCIILEATEPLDFAPRLGIPEGEFHLLNGRAKMITKMPIRLISLSLMDLHACRTLWDVGFCTGSISVEARLQFPHLRVTSFEIRDEGATLMPDNSRRFGTPGIDYRIGDFLEADVSDLDAPDAVFIGGHGGELIPFVRKLTDKMQGRGRIVFNSVSEGTLTLFRQAVAEVGWQIDHELTIALDDHNPITILRAVPR